MGAIRRADRLGPGARAGAAAAFLAIAAGVAVLLKRVRPPGGQAATAERGELKLAAASTQQCACGQEFRVSGAGRHRVVWPEGADERDALLDDRCPACDRPLAPEEEHAAAA